MDILIKNMEMPRSCEDCFVCHECSSESFDYCNILKAMTTRGEIRKDCPLIALPSHGRLCDLDSLIEHETYNIEQALFDSDEVLEDLKNAPVIVEATE